MNVQVHDFPKTPKEPEKPIVKRRTVSITNCAPITIIEDEWPVIAESGWGDDNSDAPWGWHINMKVRKPKVPEGKRLSEYDICNIIHAVYSMHDETTDDLGASATNQVVRVGRLLTGGKCCLVNSYSEPIHPHKNEAMGDLWKHIRAVGEELRERILLEDNKKYVTLVVDRVLGGLTPRDVL